MGGSLSVRDELWGPHKHLRAAGRWRCPEEELVQQPALRLELNPVSAWTSLSQQIRPKKIIIRLSYPPTALKGMTHR